MIALFAPLDLKARSLLDAHFQGRIVEGDRIHEQAPKIRAALIRSQTEAGAKWLSQLPNLNLLVSATSGTDHIDFAECEKRGVGVFHTPEAHSDSVAEHTFHLLFALIKHPALSGQAKSWRSAKRGWEIRGKTLGIVGLGRIGSRVAKIAHAFGMKVLASDPHIEECNFFDAGAESLSFSELLRSSDVVSLHVPLTQETRHLINGSTIELMSSEALLINTSRGRVVCENDLVQALQEGRLRGAGLDVFESEPLTPTSPLYRLPNVVLTPHVAAYTEEAFERSSMDAVRILISKIGAVR